MVGTKLAPPAGSGAKLTTRLLAALMALVLCAGLMPAIPAWAAEAPATPAASAAPAAAEQTAGTATLTVVAGSQTDWDTNETTYDTWVNKTYQFEQGATVKDLLDAAVAASDLGGYASSESSFGLSLDGITSASGVTQNNEYGAPTSVYWALSVDGGYADEGFADTELEDGHSYQLALTSYASFSTPSNAEEWKVYYDANPLSGNGQMSKDMAGLTVVAGSQTDWNTGEVTYDSWVNKEYALNDVASYRKKAVEELVIADLLEYAVSKGDLKAVNISEGKRGLSLDGITSKDGAEYAVDYAALGGSLYWSIYEKGGYSGIGIGAKIEGGAPYQLAWTFYSSIGTPASGDQWASYYQANKPGVGQGSASGSEVVKPPVDQFVAAGIDASQLDDLARNIAASYEGVKYSDVTDAWKYMELAAIGQAESVDREAFLSEALSEMKGDDTTRFQRNIIALTALGYDATALPDGDGAYNAIEAMAQGVGIASFNNALIFTLTAYACGGYEVPADAVLSEEALVSTVLGKQFSNGGFAFNNDSTSVDMTAYAISALQPYRSDYPEVAKAIDGALAFLKNAQKADGGFGFYLDDAESNVYSTATAIVALCTAGIDPATSWATEGGATPLSSLLSFAAEDLSGFVFGGKVNDMATEQGFRALVAYQGLKNTGAAYNVYTQAAKGEAALPSAPNPQDPAAGEAPSGSALAPTGDDAGASAGVAAVALLGALACAMAARRKASRTAEDVVVR